MARYDIASGVRPLRPAANVPLAIDNRSFQIPDAPGPLSRGGMVGGVLPGCRPPLPVSPPQPALVISNLLISKSGSEEASLYYIHKSLVKASAFSISEPRQPVDVSTPEHEHARLQAKQIYLQERLGQHAAAGHPDSHFEVTQKKAALQSVQNKMKDLEAAGHTSDLSHHSDWMHHLSQNPGGKYTPEHVNVGLSSHLSAVGGAGTQSKRQEMGIHSGMGVSGGPKKLSTEATRPSAEMPTVVGSRPSTGMRTVASSPGAKARRDAPPIKGRSSSWGSTGGPQLTAMKAIMELLEMAKSDGKKSDDWISDKIRLLMHEGKPQDQAIAIAYSMAGRSRVKKSSPKLLIS